MKNTLKRAKYRMLKTFSHLYVSSSSLLDALRTLSALLTCFHIPDLQMVVKIMTMKYANDQMG